MLYLVTGDRNVDLRHRAGPKGLTGDGMHGYQAAQLGYSLAVQAAERTVTIYTFSEHVFNGVRLAIRKRLLSPEKVVILFYTDEPDPVTGDDAITVLINQDGRIESWPDGFFDQTDHDLTALLTPVEELLAGSGQSRN